jgi:hypothetical protein
VIVDALSSLDLLRPRRSTVSANVATPAPPTRATAVAAALSTEDVRRDVEDLGWRACPVGSVLSIRAGASASSPVPLAAIPPASASSAVQRVLPPPPLPLPDPPAAPGVAAKRKRAPRGRGKAATKRRETRMRDLLTLPSVEDMSAQWQGEGGIGSATV